MTLPRGNMYRLKSKGPKMDPWGIPQVIQMFFELWSPRATKYSRPVVTGPARPTQFSSLLIRISWSTVSKAALRSRRARTVIFFLSQHSFGGNLQPWLMPFLFCDGSCDTNKTTTCANIFTLHYTLVNRSMLFSDDSEYWKLVVRHTVRTCQSHFHCAVVCVWTSHLRQGGYVFLFVCLSVCLFICLFVSRIMLKLPDWFSWNFVKEWSMVQGRTS